LHFLAGSIPHEATLSLELTVRFLGGLGQIVGARNEKLEIYETSTVIDVLKILASKHGIKLKEYLFEPETNKPRHHLRFLVNGKSASVLDELPSQDSVLIIFPPTSGG